MKISYSNYPILEKLHKGSLASLPILSNDIDVFNLIKDTYSKYWFMNVNKFQKEINIISRPFADASLKARERLMDLYKDITINDASDLEINGCYILGDFVYMICHELKKGVQDNELFFYMFTKKGIPLAIYIDSNKYKMYQYTWVSKSWNFANSAKDITNFINIKLSDIIIFNLFKLYAQVETKILKPNTKLKEIDCKYVNDTKFKLTYLDSKWFTNLVKSDGFNVRGHFRLQPKKNDGAWTKELIWISEFQKSGYTSKARKIEYITQKQ